MRLPQSTRLRLTPYFLLLALPLSVGVWAFGNYSAGQARDRADTRLHASLIAAASAYRHEVAKASVQARELAGRADVQRAVRERRRAPLARLAREHPHAAFVGGGRVLAGRIAPNAPRRTVGLSNGRRVFGTVVVSVPVDPALLPQLAAKIGLRKSDRLRAFARPVPSTGDVRV